MAKKLKLGGKVRVKKNLSEEEILEEYYDGPLGEEIEKEILDFYSNTEAVYILEDALDGNFSTKGFSYVLIDRFLELVEEVGMNFIEAFKKLDKGEEIKRKNWNFYLQMGFEDRPRKITPDYACPYNFEISDVLAEDWEIHEVE